MHRPISIASKAWGAYFEYRYSIRRNYNNTNNYNQSLPNLDDPVA